MVNKPEGQHIEVPTVRNLRKFVKLWKGQEIRKHFQPMGLQIGWQKE